MVATKKQLKAGKVTQIIGPVIDAEFPSGKLPRIYNSLTVEGKNSAGETIKITCEVQQLLGDNQVRAVSMSGTDGLIRGMSVTDSGSPISVPVGKETLGRIFNVLGEPVDQRGEVGNKEFLSLIHI